MPIFLTSLFGGIGGYIAVALLAGILGAYGGYRWELGSYEALKASDVTSQLVVVQKAKVLQQSADAVSLAIAVREARAQQQIITQTVTVTKEVPIYVHDTVSCPGLSVGAARVLRAAAAGVDPASLALAPGQSDDSCSDFTASEMAGWFAQYAGAAQANTQKLTDLQATIKAWPK